MMARFRCRNEERERTGIKRKKKKVPAVERMRRNEREEGKGAARNTKRRRKGDRIDERDMEDEGKDREREG
jgi:hypothetical protein